MIRDYRRPDGSVYLRAPGPSVLEHRTAHVLTDRQSRPIHRWGRTGAWYHHWLLTLLGTDERGYVISDGRDGLKHLLPLPDERFRVIHVMHNVHTESPFRWNSALAPTYGPLLDAIAMLDGLVSLTHRQREDVRERSGRTNNLFTVANPVVPPAVPDPRPERDRNLFTIVTRFDDQKRIDQAVNAFALVVAERPAARLAIYGGGAPAAAIQRLIDRLDLNANIKLCGWDPDARETLWTSSGFLMSSAFEGYPLATLESLGRGCPVISYDIKYGPREQIVDGVDGFLVADGDQRGMADRVIQLIDDPALVQRLSTAALATAVEHDYRAFLADWAQVLTTVEANRAKRVTLTKVRLEVDTLGYRPTPLPARITSRVPIRTGAAALRGDRRMIFAGTLKVRGEWPRGALKRARVTLDAVSEHTDMVTRIPLDVVVDKQKLRLRSTFRLDRLFADRAADDTTVTLRLRFVLRNASWETVVTRPSTGGAGYEIGFDQRNRLVLRHGTT